MRNIYHITHINNLPSIILEHAVYCNATVNTKAIAPVNIAHGNIKYRRSQRSVPCASAGMVTDYVPFYFAPRSPMLYAILKGNVHGYRDGQEPVVYLVTNVEAVDAYTKQWVFSDGGADDESSKFYGDLEDLNSKIDWNLMDATYWDDRTRERRAEFLVHRSLQWGLIASIGVMNLSMQEKVSEILDTYDPVYRPKIVIHSDWYYGEHRA